MRETRKKKIYTYKIKWHIILYRWVSDLCGSHTTLKHQEWKWMKYTSFRDLLKRHGEQLESEEEITRIEKKQQLLFSSLNYRADNECQFMGIFASFFLWRFKSIVYMHKFHLICKAQERRNFFTRFLIITKCCSPLLHSAIKLLSTQKNFF